MPAEGHTGETVLRFLSDFDTQRGEGHVGVPELGSLSFNSLQDYAGLVKQFDFTSVDLGAAKGLIDQLGQAASKRAFETVGSFVDRGLEVASGALGATGQWYGFAAGVLGEKFLDWAEAAFETSMGWDDLELIKVGEWVALNKGFTTRRRLFGADDFDPHTEEEMHAEDKIVELQKKERVARNVQIGITQGAPNDGYVQVFNTQTGQSENVRLEDIRKLDKREKDTLDRDSVLGQLPELLAREDEPMLRLRGGGRESQPYSKVGGMRGAREVTPNGASKQVGDFVVFEGLLYEIKAVSPEMVRIEANGIELEVRWSRLRPATNYSGDVNGGEYVWLKHSDDEFLLYLVQGTKGSEAYVWSTFTGKPTWVDTAALLRVGPNENLNGGVFGRFKLAIMEGQSQAIHENRPGMDSATSEMCKQRFPDVRQVREPVVVGESGNPGVFMQDLGDSGYHNMTAGEARDQDAMDAEYEKRPWTGGREVSEWYDAPEEYGGPPRGGAKSRSNTTTIALYVAGAALVVYVITR